MAIPDIPGRSGAMLPGLPHPLRYTVNALCAMEAVCPQLEGVFDRPFEAARLLFWGGLLHAVPTLSIEEAGCMMDDCLASGGTFEAITSACAEALEAAGLMPGDAA